MTIESIFAIAVLVMSVVIHEVSHGYVAYFLGDPTARLAGRLTLNPLKHLDPVGSILVPGVLILLGGLVFGWAKPVPYNPHQLRAGRWGPALVAVAGPASNLLIALIFSLVLRLAVPVGILPAAALPLVTLVVLLNIMLAIFNLIPIVPLDGSKLLFALLPYQWRHLEEFFYRYHLIILILFIFLIVNTPILSRLVYGLFRFLVG